MFSVVVVPQKGLQGHDDRYHACKTNDRQLEPEEGLDLDDGSKQPLVLVDLDREAERCLNLGSGEMLLGYGLTKQLSSVNSVQVNCNVLLRVEDVPDLDTAVKGRLDEHRGAAAGEERAENESE